MSSTPSPVAPGAVPHRAPKGRVMLAVVLGVTILVLLARVGATNGRHHGRVKITYDDGAPATAYAEEVDRTYDLAAGGLLKLSVDAGDLGLHAGEPGVARVRVVFRDDVPDDFDWQEKSIDPEGIELEIRAHARDDGRVRVLNLKDHPIESVVKETPY